MKRKPESKDCTRDHVLFPRKIEIKISKNKTYIYRSPRHQRAAHRKHSDIWNVHQSLVFDYLFFLGLK